MFYSNIYLIRYVAQCISYVLEHEAEIPTLHKNTSSVSHYNGSQLIDIVPGAELCSMMSSQFIWMTLNNILLTPPY